MINYYIQPFTRGWYVMRDATPMARCSGAGAAVDLAMLLAERAKLHGEEAVFAGMATESAPSWRISRPQAA